MNTTLIPGSLPTQPKAKRTRKPSTPRVRNPKDPGILAIEAQAKAAKEQYRKAQSSQVILERITEKLIPKLTASHRQKLFDELSKTETPKLLAAPSHSNDTAGRVSTIDDPKPYGIVNP